jgi:DNA-binding IclR family transcriptional regulator
MGRVVLAFSDEETQARILARPLQAFSPRAIVNPAQLRKRLAFARKHYYEVAINENGYGIATLAAPVFDADNRLAAAVSVVGSPFSVTATPNAKLLKAVQDCAAAISAELNSTAWKKRRAK